VVLHAGGVVDNRAHVGQQYLVELGATTSSGSVGFLARVAQATGVRSAAIDRRPPNSLAGVRPIVLEDPVRLQPSYTDGLLDPHWTRAQRLAMYRGTDCANRRARQAAPCSRCSFPEQQVRHHGASEASENEASESDASLTWHLCA
jgi:hypothetical protein